jgi:uncharacterized membrane protein
MDPEIVLAFLLVIAGAVAFLVLLGLVISLRQSQEKNHQDLSFHLRLIERTVERMHETVLRLAKGEKETPPSEKRAPEPAPAPVHAPVETFVAPEVVSDVPASQPSTPPQPPTLPREVQLPKPSWKPPRRELPVAELDEPAPREPSHFETAAKEILRKIGRWILIGEDELAEGESLEYAVASNWLLRISVLLIVMGVGFFLNYSIKQGWINEVGQVLLCAAAGVGLLIAGTQLLGRKYHLLGQGLIGAGIAILYLSVYAARVIFGLIDDTPAFVLMILVTCIAGWIAVRFNSLLVAVLGILGGFGTPIMLRTGVVNYVGLYTYLLVLSAGVFGVTYKKNWPLLNALSFIGTYGLFFGTLADWDYQAVDFWQVMPFLIAFFALYSTMTFLFNMANRKKSSLLEVLGLWINAGVFFATSYVMVKDAYPGPAAHPAQWVAVVSLGLAAFYAAHVYYCLIRRLLDRELLLSFTALSAFFVAITIPLVLSAEWITASWALQALIMLWIAGKLQSEFLRQVAYVLYAIVLVRFGFLDLDRQYSLIPEELPLGEYLWQMLDRVMCLGIPIGSLAGAGWLLQHEPAKAALSVERDNDIGPWVGRRWAVGAVVAMVVGMLFLALHLELNQSVAYFCEPLRMPMLTLLWIALCGFLLHQYRLRPNGVLLVLLMVFSMGMVAKLFCFDLVSWHLTHFLRYGVKGYSFLEGGMRLLDFGAIVAFLTGGYYLLAKTADNHDSRIAGIVFGYAALALSLLFCTLEVNSFLYAFMPGSEAGGVSIVWSLFALGLIIGGMWKDSRWLRYCGLALFAIVAWKVLFSDLKHLDQVYRIVAFLLLGVLVLCGSFVYLKCRPIIAAIRNRQKEEDQP